MTRALTAAAAALLVTFVLLTVLVVDEADPLLAFDQTVASSVAERTTPALTELAAVVTWLGSSWVALGLLAPVVVALTTRGRFRLAAAAAVTVAGSALLNSLVKLAVGRERPPLLAAAAVVAIVGLVGWSRVALSVHWPSDVLGGWLLGSAWVLAATAVLTHWCRDGGAGPDGADGTSDPAAVDAGRSARPHPVDR